MITNAVVRVLTDCVGQITQFVSGDPVWDRHAVLTEVDSCLWQALGMGSPVVADVTSETFWQHLVIIAEASSSQVDALQAAIGGGLRLSGPTLCLALMGRGFRGQRGRLWSTQKGNLFLTVGLTPNRPAAENAASLVMLPAVAVIDTIGRLTGCQATIKWVNDILIGERKVGGVLAVSHCRGDMIEAAVLGIGVNVVLTPEIESTPFVPVAGSLAESGARVSLAELFVTLADALRSRYQFWLEHGPRALLSAYREASCVMGRRVCIWDESTERPLPGDQPLASGVVERIEDDLSLRLRGSTQAIHKGRLAFADTAIQWQNRAF